MKTRRIYLDLFDQVDPPTAGDVLVSTRVAYLVRAARPVDSRLWDDRWNVEVVPLGDRDGRDARSAIAEAENVHRMGTYRRGERPRDFAARHGLDG